jgi:drug/metabolite transporter (DMT)-like permease|tara:strand:- start:53 stop:949 length:897 start_codon:yes stop_codon:yes gene_type:complete
MILMKNYKSTLLLFVLSALWALHFSLVKLVDADKNPLSILVPLLVVLTILFYFVLNFNNQLFKFTFRKSIFFTVAGIFAYVVPLYVEFLVAPKMDSGILVLIVSSVPVFTLIIVWIFRLLDVNVRLILGTFFGLVGISIIILGDTNKSVNFWALLALIVPLSYSFDAIFMEKYWPNELNTFQVAFGECFASLVLLIIFNFLFDANFSEYIYWISLPSFWLLTFVTFIEISLFFYILKIRGAVFINLGSYLVMPAGFLWGFIIFGETFTLVKLVCTLLIISSIFLIGNHEYKIKNTPIE